MSGPAYRCWDWRRKVIPTQEEMVKLILAAGELRTFFLALYSLAARVSEINRLRWEDVNFERREVKLWTRKNKGGGWREQKKAMNEELYQELQRLYEKQRRIRLSESRDRPAIRGPT